MLVVTRIIALLMLISSIAFGNSDVVGAYVDYSSVTGGPALMVLGAEQASDGSWYVHSNDKRFWKWENNEWTMLVDDIGMAQRPHPIGAVGLSSNDRFTYIGAEHDVFTTGSSLERAPIKTHTFAHGVVQSRMFRNGAIAMSTAGTLTRLNAKGEEVAQLYATQSEPVSFAVSGDTVVVYESSGHISVLNATTGNLLVEGTLTSATLSSSNVGFANNNIFVLSGQKIDVFSLPNFNTVGSIQIPFAASSLSLSASGFVAIREDSKIATSTNSGVTWSTTEYSEWKLNGVVAGDSEFCVFGEMGEVHFSRDGVTWTNDKRHIKNKISDIVPIDGWNTLLLTTGAEVFQIVDRSNVTVPGWYFQVSEFADILDVLDTRSRWDTEEVLLRLSDTLLAVVEAETNGVLTYTVPSGIDAACLQRNGIFVLSQEAVYTYEKNGESTFQQIPEAILHEKLLGIGSTSLLSGYYLLTESSLWWLDADQQEGKRITQITDNVIAFTHNVDAQYGLLLKDSLVLGYQGLEHTESCDCEALGFANYGDFTLIVPTPICKDWVVDVVRNELVPLPMSAVSASQGAVNGISTFLSDSATIGRVYWDLTTPSVDEAIEDLGVRISIESVEDGIVSFAVESEQTHKKLTWQITDLQGKTLSVGNVSTANGKGTVRCNNLAKGMFILTVVGDGGGRGICKFYYE